MRTAQRKRADADAIRIMGPPKDETGDDEESGCRGYRHQGPAVAYERATIKRADAEVIQITGPPMGSEKRQYREPAVG